MEGQQWYFEDFRLGQQFSIPAKTLTESHFLLFAALSGDQYPLHYDEEYCKKTRFGKRVAHGFLINMLTALGASNISQAVEEAMIAFLSQSSRFLKPAFIGDTLRPRLEVVGLVPKGDKGVVEIRSTVTNQRGELVLEGSHTYLLKSRG
ncbi:MAG TPA: dehydratase [Dehalococcoidia bacterium]|nr:dehydratase [Dehalococcoidia bacterium]